MPIYEKDEFIYGLEDEIEKTSRTFKLGNKQQEHNLIDALKIACRKFTKEKTGKKPFTNINLVRFNEPTGLAIIYIIIWWIVFFAILPIDVERNKVIKIDGEDPGSPENPKMLKKFIYCTGITTVLFIIIYLLNEI